MKLRSCLLCTLLAVSLPAEGALTLENADSLWLFDAGTVGSNATAGQIVDASGNGHSVTSASNLPGLMSQLQVPMAATASLRMVTASS